MSLKYLQRYISTFNQSYQARNGDKFLHIPCRAEYFENSYFPYAIKEWNNLRPEILKLVSHEVFQIHY